MQLIFDKQLLKYVFSKVSLYFLFVLRQQFFWAKEGKYNLQFQSQFCMLRKIATKTT